MAELRAMIFLYTDAAEIDEATKAAMIEHGYLPVKVTALDAVKFLTTPMVIPQAEMSAITAAALEAINDNPEGFAAHEFGPKLARRLLASESAKRRDG